MALQRLSAVAGLVDLLDEEAGLTIRNADDVEEVGNCLQAFEWVQDQLRSPRGLPLSVRMWNEAHRRLMDGARGSRKQPGELRRSQNWIGGTRPGHSVCVPLPPDQVPGLLADLERFIHAQPSDLPALVRVALVHAQFESIHPCLDGNGRIGRLLIAALLEHWQLLPEPLMCLSGCLKQHQLEYDRRLSAIRTEGDWEGWVQFFLEAVQEAAAQSERSVDALASLVAQDRRRLLAHAKATAFSCRLFELLPTMPRLSVDRVSAVLQTTFPTASAAVKLPEELGILQEQTGQKKNRIYSCAAYIQLLSQ